MFSGRASSASLKTRVPLKRKQGGCARLDSDRGFVYRILVIDTGGSL
jgi:hypothetical protein